MGPDKAFRRLMAKVNSEGGADACWCWFGCCDRDGYGQTGGMLGERRAHRAMWVATHGPIADGMCVLHHCDRPSCINPRHLFLGTQADNQHDRHSKGRYATGNAHHWRRRPETVRRGDHHPGAKLTDDQVREIRSRYVARYGMQTRLAREYGVSQSAIWCIVHGVNRKAA